MDYKEEYQNALERAKQGLPIDEVFPELKESEDERIRSFLYEFIKVCGWSEKQYPPREKCLAYLEKQKDLTKDIMPGYPAHYFYDGEKMHFCGNPAMEKKQEEQKPHFELKVGKWYICYRAYCARADHLTVKEGERFQCEKDGVVKGFVIKEPEKYFRECSAPAPMEDKPKPAEWSERDELMLRRIIERGESFVAPGGVCSLLPEHTEWLRLRLKLLCNHWKPSKEQMDNLLRAINIGNFGENKEIRTSLHNLFYDLKKLIGKE